MPKLPVLSGEELLKLLIKAGFRRVRQKGSHVSLQKGEFKQWYLFMMNLPGEPFWEYQNSVV